MANALKARWLGLMGGLWFVPSLVVVAYGIVAVALVEVDRRVDWSGVDVVFRGDDSAARTVLSVVAGSLITVAGLTFSITIVVLQLASSQFSPRVLRNLFGDRVTQATVGTFVGIFVYALLVLRAVGDFGEESGFVPRLSVTVAAALAIGAVVLLVVFIHHVAQTIQVSHIAGGIGRRTLERIEQLYPEPFGEPVEAEAEELLEEWHAAGEPGHVHASRPGYVVRVGLDELIDDLDEAPERLHVLVAPGDFVAADEPVAAVWPAAAAEACAGPIRRAVAIGDERDDRQDAAFGLRQLTDIALRAVSPSLNDPTTAVTCIGYMRSSATALAARGLPSPVRRFEDGPVVVSRRRSFAEHLEGFLEIGRYASGDARVVVALLGALRSVAEAAGRARAAERVDTAVEAARTIVEQAVDEAGSDRDRAEIAFLLGEVERAGRPLRSA